MRLHSHSADLSMPECTICPVPSNSCNTPKVCFEVTVLLSKIHKLPAQPTENEQSPQVDGMSGICYWEAVHGGLEADMWLQQARSVCSIAQSHTPAQRRLFPETAIGVTLEWLIGLVENVHDAAAC